MLSKKLFYAILKINAVNKFRQKRRFRITTSCKDCDYIPKVKKAGEVCEKDGHTYQIMHNGVKVKQGAYHGPMMTNMINSLKGHHEPQEEKLFYEVLKHINDGAVMLELGSFWSYYSLWFNRVIKNAVNYMIEPQETNLEIGKSNFKLNSAEGVFTRAFVGSTDDEKIPQVTVDTFLSNNSIDFLSILHSDIQGAEYDMLKGAEKSLTDKKIGFLFISTHSDDIHNKCTEFLLEHDYSILASHTIGESFSADGLIVSKIKNISGPTNIKISKRHLLLPIFKHL